MEERVCVYFSFVWFVYVAMCSPGPTKYIFHMPMARYSLYVLKVPLNIKQTNKQLLHGLHENKTGESVERGLLKFAL